MYFAFFIDRPLRTSRLLSCHQTERRLISDKSPLFYATVRLIEAVFKQSDASERHCWKRIVWGRIPFQATAAISISLPADDSSDRCTSIDLGYSFYRIATMLLWHEDQSEVVIQAIRARLTRLTMHCSQTRLRLRRGDLLCGPRTAPAALMYNLRGGGTSLRDTGPPIHDPGRPERARR